MEKPTTCRWCNVETTDLAPYRKFSQFARGMVRDEGDVWWLSPCCANDLEHAIERGSVVRIERMPWEGEETDA